MQADHTDIDGIAEKKGLPRIRVIECLAEALTKAASDALKRKYPVEARYDDESGEVRLYRLWKVVPQVRNHNIEIDVFRARSQWKPTAQVGEEILEPLDYDSKTLEQKRSWYFQIFLSKAQLEKENSLNTSESRDISRKEHISSSIKSVVRERPKRRVRIDPKSPRESCNNIASFQVPSRPNKDFFPFQKTAIKFIHERESVLLADEMGLGKTITVIGAINLDESLKKILIVCPLSIKSVWRKELNGWMVRKLSIGEGTSDYCPARGYDILIIHYDIVHKFSDVLRKIQWDLIVLDEAHYIKSRQSQRTKAIVGFYNRSMKKWTTQMIDARKKLLLTGTPIMNRPAELWPLVNYLDKKNFGKYDEFVETYCDTDPYYLDYDQEPRGYSNLQNLNRLLKSTVMIRRTKEEVLPELPKKLRTIMEVPAITRMQKDAVDEMSKAWGKYEKDISALEKQCKSAVTAKNDQEYAWAVQQLTKAYHIAFFEMSSVRKKIGIQKVPIVLDHLEDLLATDQKIVVFAHHHEVMDLIKDHFPGSVKITGKTPSSERADIVARFQNDPDVRLFIGSIKAAGTGITLNASSTVVFAELDWVPANLDQAEDRLHRIGQSSNVLVHHIVFEGSIDARMARVIVEKQSIVRSILN